MVVFAGHAEFKTSRPQNVFWPEEAADQILGRREVLLSAPQIKSAVAAVERIAARAKRL